MVGAESGEGRTHAPLDPAIQPGILHRDEVLLTDRHLTRHVGGKGVFATPAMIWLMENASHNSVAPYLLPAQTTVGYEVHVFHRAPAELGDRIVIESRLAEVDRNRLTFEVRATKDGLLLGEGIHRRAIVGARG
ncbi:MAG: thioesterase [Candidatus Dormibacteraeota bacterium]|nr:thioesterase [Candidatus Dormibacteraeota bacterium]MBO0743389.1 thioesterase [Candidatus Dormibacteraeota bacterium]